MKELFIFFILAVASFVGAYSLVRYKEDNPNIKVGFWKGLLIFGGFACFSIIIIPSAIAKWAVKSMLDFKDE